MPDDVKMPAYIGTKIVKATPMTKEAFEIEKGNNDVGPIYHAGYKVIYPDGYESWSPKETFEAAYRLVSDDERRMI